MTGAGYVTIYANAVAIMLMLGVNTLAARLKVKEALSGIDVALTKRYDVLTKMLDVVKGYQAYERETLTQLVRLRSGMTMNERQEASGRMDQLSGQIRLLAENYPELRSSQNFAELQRSIVDVEEHLQGARRAYNANVSTLNQKVISFPTSIVAGSAGIGQEAFFEAEAQKRQDVNVKIDI